MPRSVIPAQAGIQDDYYCGHDHLYSPTVLFDPAGNVAERYEYDAYGKANILSSNYSLLTSSQFANPYLFTGRRLDTMDSGSLTIYHYRARGYDAETGRFMQRDPLGYVDGMNLYEYVKSNPLGHFDPSGLKTKKLPDWKTKTGGPHEFVLGDGTMHVYYYVEGCCTNRKKQYVKWTENKGGTWNELDTASYEWDPRWWSTRDCKVTITKWTYTETRYSGVIEGEGVPSRCGFSGSKECCRYSVNTTWTEIYGTPERVSHYESKSKENCKNKPKDSDPVIIGPSR